MKRFLIGLLVSCCSLTSFAQLPSNGYYRLQNVGSTRYAYIVDNRGSVSIGSTSADLGAIDLWRGFERAVSNPASIIYFIKVGDKSYRFEAQGVNSYDIVTYDLLLKENRGDYAGTYRAYQSKGGNTSYLCDAEHADRDRGAMGTNDRGTNYRYWYVHPVDANSDHYFGVQPEYTVRGKQYTSFFADFPFSFASTGMKAFYVKSIERGMVIVEEVAAGKVAAATPVIIECSSDQPSSNKLNIGANGATAPAGNLLNGVYFCNLHGTDEYRGNHWNAKEYNRETMRVLGVNAEGRLAFKTADIDYLPANKAYLNVPAGTQNELLVVTQKEFDDIIASGIDGVIADSQNDDTIYSMTGRVVGHGFAQLKQLPSGVYAISGKKYVVK